MKTKTRSSGRGPSSLSDHASVKGVRRGKANRRRSPAGTVARSGFKSRKKTIFKAGAVVGLFAGLGLLSVECHHRLHHSPRFAIDQVSVKGHRRVQADVLVRMAGVHTGDNIFAIDLTEIERELSLHPWVADVSVSRVLPRNLLIEIREHEPVVMVALGHLYYANAEAEIVKRYTPGEKESFPVVTGLSRDGIEADESQAYAGLRRAIDFLNAWNQNPESSEIAEIHMDEIMGLSFVTKQDDTSVVMGWGPWSLKIRRLRAVKQVLQARGVMAKTITIGGPRRPDRVVARISETEAPASLGHAVTETAGRTSAMMAGAQ